jgi:hypothetical protein
MLVMSDLNIETRPCSEESRIFPMYLMRRGGMLKKTDFNLMSSGKANVLKNGQSQLPLMD